MAFDAYLKIQDITTGSVNGIELESFSWGVSNSGSPATGDASSAGQVSLSDFSFTARLGPQSPQLFQKCVEGFALQSAVLTLVGTPSQIMIKFTDVLVSSYKEDEQSVQTTRDAETGRAFINEAPMESVSLNFSKIEYSFGSVVGTGGGTGKIS